MEVIKTFAIVYSTTGKGSSYKDVASKVGANANNVSSSLKFWKEVGFLSDDESGYIPSKTLVDFNQKIQWGDENSAWTIFHDALRNTWFLNEIVIKFQLKSKISFDDLMKSLGLASGLQYKDTNTIRSLQMLIQLLELSKILEKDDDGNYNLKSDSLDRSKGIVVDNSKNLLQVRIGDNLYAIDVNEMKSFVIEKGKEISKDIQRIE